MWLVVGLLVIIAILLALALWEVGAVLQTTSATSNMIAALIRDGAFERRHDPTTLLAQIETHARRIANRHGDDDNYRDDPDYGRY